MIQNKKDLQENLHLIPEPTYYFTVGDSVDIGNLKDVIIDEILFDGKGYVIDYTSINNNYGNPIKHEHQKMVVKWLDVRKQEKNKISFIENDNINLYYRQRELSGILLDYYENGINMNPSYQRDYVWNVEDKVKLIDSIFKNIDIGKFVFRKLPYTETPFLEIVDGKQRISAITEFYEDRLKYKNCYFSDLCLKDRNYFLRKCVSYAEIGNTTEKDVIRIFLMINSNGKIMDDKHLDKIRNMYEKLLKQGVLRNEI